MIAPAAQRRRGLAVHAGVLALMTALALAYTWPLPTHLGTRYAVRVPPPAPLSADLLFSSWILASDARRLVHDPLHVFETNNFYPFRHTLAYGENLLGVAVLVLPVQLGWDNPTLTHNVAMLLTLVLGGWGMFLLVRELSGMTLAGLLAGALVIYSPHVWAHVILLPLMAGHWSPVALFLLVSLQLFEPGAMDVVADHHALVRQRRDDVGHHDERVAAVDPRHRPLV